MGTEQIFDGNKVYSISGDDKEVTIAKPTGSETMFSLLIILTLTKTDIQYSIWVRKTLAESMPII